MANFSNYFIRGLKNTLLFRNNGSISHNGPATILQNDTLLDRWHVNDFSTAEYIVSADLNDNNKEIIKALVTATTNDAHLVEYARNSTNIDIIEMKVLVTSSYVDVYVNPKIAKAKGAKLIFTAQYFQNQNPIT